LRYGVYQVGIASESKLSQNIHDIIFVKLNPGDKILAKTFYNLDELRDLESKLVLITGSKTAIRTEVDHYSNVCAHNINIPIFTFRSYFSSDPPTCD
jgi:heptaprenylglyceryl phosphate synthase